MPKLTDEMKLKHFQEVLSLWAVECYIHWLSNPAEWVLDNLGVDKTYAVMRCMYEHLANGEAINEVPEERENWRDMWDFYYEFRLSVEGTDLYIETRLEMETDPEDSTLHIVSIHHLERGRD